MYKLNISDLAKSDLDEIVDYIAEKLMNPKAATDFLDELEKCYSYLETNPYIYAICSEAELKIKGYRKAGIKKYLMVFQIDEETKTVIILRFFYGTRNYIDLL